MCPSRGNKRQRLSQETSSASDQEVTDITSGQMALLKCWGLGNGIFPYIREGEENQILVNTIMSAKEKLSNSHCPCSTSCLCPILTVYKILLSLAYWLP